jgi:sugar/nucleoside kinase (ribokinase family)
MNILGMGNAIVDILIELPDDSFLEEFGLQKGNMQLIDKSFSTHILNKTAHLKKTEVPGGSAANAIHGLAKLGVETAFIGKIGSDRLGVLYENALIHNGIKSLLQRSRNETAHSLVLITPDGERTFATYLGAAMDLEPDDLNPEIFEYYTHFYIEGYLMQHHELIRHACELATDNSLDVILDMGSSSVVESNHDFLKYLLKEYVNIVFANADEARSFSKEKDADKALEELAKDVLIAVVKHGKDGSVVQKGQQIRKISAIEANCIDTTGAGDLYAAGFMYGMLRAMKFNDCGEIGSLLAGKVIEVIGPKLSDEKWDEVIKIIENKYNVKIQ